jgi:DNA-directed RNA polymerase subunit RPC12/RpoP
MVEKGKCGPLRHCNCGSSFHQQNLPVFTDNEKRAYIVCPYCSDRRIYIGTMVKKPVVKTVMPYEGKFDRNPDLLTVITF